MTREKRKNEIMSRIWQEEAEPDNPFAARTARCHGFDVYGDMLGKARWVEMLYLLFRGEVPSPAEASLLDALALVLANPGPRDASVHAAMCGGTSGTPAAAVLMAALAVGAGQLSGGREVLLAVQDWAECGTDRDAWHQRLSARPAPAGVSAWPEPEHPPGFDPHGVRTPLIVEQTLACLAGLSPGTILPWLAQQRNALEDITGLPLSLTGVAAAAFADLGFSPQQAEMLHLLLRLPGAAAHALEQQELGHKKFPLYEIEFETNLTDQDQEIEA
jgi:citrate synthase